MLRKITRDELIRLIDSGRKMKIVDVLPQDSYEKGHIKGAISIPYDDIESKAPALIRKNELVVVYCASFDCLASTGAAEKLLAMGYKNILDYKGGLKDYKEGGLPMEGALHDADTGLRRRSY